MRGWFDAFRHDGGPTLYDRTNRTAVTVDVSTITFCVIFLTLYVAFLIILPGVRKEVSVLAKPIGECVCVWGNFHAPVVRV